MKPDYKNWVPNSMIYGGCAGAAVSLIALFCVRRFCGEDALKTVLTAVAVIALIGSAGFAVFCAIWHSAFSYNGKRQLSKAIIEGTAAYVTLPEGGVGLDVGCGSGALTIACAKRNPKARMVGIDRWGAEYYSFSKQLCENNAKAEGVTNTSYQKGDACRLDFADETFDAVVSNYVYHNIAGVNKQNLLRERLRVLKKGGTFAIHDLMEPVRYGDMQAFVRSLREEGYERVELIDTTNGKFMKPLEAKLLMLGGSTLLVGKK